jgi:hypothetical protein
MQFSSKRGLKCLRVAIKYNLRKIIRDIKMYIDFKILLIKVKKKFRHISFFGT